MPISVRDLFSRQNLPGEVISLRNSLANHYQGLALGLRAAHQRFLTPSDSDGYARGCHRPTQAVGGDLAYVVPSWVAAHAHATRTLEGILVRSKISSTDFPLRPWHSYYDWNFLIRPDKQYSYLHSTSNIHDHSGIIECEWDTSGLPSWAWPQDGQRVWMVGRWIYDCGHPMKHGHKTELHPPKAVVSFRAEAVHFGGNNGPTRATNAVVYIGQNGGYWRQPIAGQNYAFDLYLPPRPYPEANPVWRVTPMTGSLSVEPQISPFPQAAPQALRVVIPLQDAAPELEAYGAIIAGGWSDPRASESASIQRVRVSFTTLHMDADYDVSGDEWHVYIGLNGRWTVLKDVGGSSHAFQFAVDLDLHPDDPIRLTACGFEADMVHDFMGHESGYTWEQISDPQLTQAQREAIEDKIFWQLAGSLKDENDGIGHLSVVHQATARGTFTTAADKNDYRLSYTIATR